MKVGVLALQGAFAAHARCLRALGAEPLEVRTPAHLDDVDALVLPGGESTTMSMLLESSGLFEPVAERLADGLPTLGTCAGMILLGTEILDGRPDQRCFAAVDISVRRNAFGRQVDSFEEEIHLAGLEEPVHAVFIRAPWVESISNGVKILGAVVPPGLNESKIIAVRHHNIMATSFHPEVTDDLRIHRYFVEMVRAAQ